MIIKFSVCIDIRAIQVRHGTNTCGWTKYTTNFYEDSRGGIKVVTMQHRTRTFYWTYIEFYIEFEVPFYIFLDFHTSLSPRNSVIYTV